MTLFIGCVPRATVLPPVRGVPVGTVLAASAAELKPGALPGGRAALRLGGAVKGYPPMEFEVALARATDGADVALKLLSNGEAIERETYASGPEAFRAVTVADQSFAPPLDLLRFPARAGDAWGWSGRVTYAGTAREARARVALSGDTGDARSDVELSVAGAPKQTLAFWFRKGRGVVRRRFGDVSARGPVGEAWPP